jgi:hypothetical protein
MSLRINHPSKEQVRAYMAGREAARRPPPAPEEIRRQLGWRIARPDEDRLRLQFYLIPTSYHQLLTQITVDWLFAPLRCAGALKHMSIVPCMMLRLTETAT